MSEEKCVNTQHILKYSQGRCCYYGSKQNHADHFFTVIYSFQCIASQIYTYHLLHSKNIYICASIVGYKGAFLK